MADLDPFRPRYNSNANYAIPPRPRSVETMPRRGFEQVFSEAERADLEKLIGEFKIAREKDRNSAEARALWDQLRSYKTSVERATALNHVLGGLDKRRARAWFDATTLSPKENDFSFEDICRDEEVNTAFNVTGMGCRGRAKVWAAPGRLHASTFFSCDGTWNVVNNGLPFPLAAPTLEAAERRFLPQAFKFWGFSPVRLHTDVPLLGATSEETPVGLELRRSMHGTPGLESGLSLFDRNSAGLSLTADNEGMSLSYAGSRWSAQARAFGPLLSQTTGLPEDGPLAGSAAASLGYSLGPSFRLNFGVLALRRMTVGRTKLDPDPEDHVPEGFSARVQEPMPVTAGFIALASDGDLWDFEPHPRLHLRSDYGTRLGIVVGFRNLGSPTVDHYGAGSIDPGSTLGLSHLNFTSRHLVIWTPWDGVTLWGAGTAYLPIDDMILFGLAGGFSPVGSWATFDKAERDEVNRLRYVPLAAFGESGLALQHGPWSLATRLYIPGVTSTNLFADTPRGIASLARQGDNGLRVAATTTAGAPSFKSLGSSYVDHLSAAASYGAFTLGAGARHLSARREGWVHFDVDVSRLVSRR